MHTRKLSFIFFSLFAVSFLTTGCLDKIRGPSRIEKSPEIRVLLSEIEQKDTLTFDGKFVLRTEEATYEFGSLNNKIVLENLSNGFKIYNQNRLLLFRNSDSVYFEPLENDNLFLLGKQQYSGVVFLKKVDKKLFLINLLPVEEYLKGVVPAEIFTTKNEYLEAIKAQAICARSYALRKIEQKKPHFDVYANTNDQVYKGNGVRTDLGDQAVDETFGTVIMFNDKLAEVYYHSTDGGIQADVAELWPEKRAPYLTSRQDLIGNEFACSQSPYFRWEKMITANKFDSLYLNFYGEQKLNKEVQDTTKLDIQLTVTERTRSGRIKFLKLNYADNEKTLKDYEIRRFFSLSQGKLLPSLLFKINTKNNNFILKGAGNGHGVGMCQYGAMYKSEKGMRYYHILQSYFPGTKLKKIY